SFTTTSASAPAPRLAKRGPWCSREARRPRAPALTIRGVDQPLLQLCQIEKVPPCPVLGLDDPGVGIEADLLGEPLLHRLLRYRLFGNRREHAFGGPARVIGGLRRRRIEHGIAVEQCYFYEYRPRLLGTAPAHRTEHALALAA